MDSRYIKNVTERLPRKKKTNRLPGAFEDDGKYYKCWNCGFICNATRDEVGEGSGVQAVLTGDSDSTTYAPNVVSGCPFCGSKNYR